MVAAIREAGPTATLTLEAEYTITQTQGIAIPVDDRSATRAVETPVVARSSIRVAVIHHRAVVVAVE